MHISALLAVLFVTGVAAFAPSTTSLRLKGNDVHRGMHLISCRRIPQQSTKMSLHAAPISLAALSPISLAALSEQFTTSQILVRQEIANH